MATASMTAAMRLPAASVTVMEASAPLKRRLATMGYVPRDDFDDADAFGAVALLNVLDRCAKPARLLIGAAIYAAALVAWRARASDESPEYT